MALRISAQPFLHQDHGVFHARLKDEMVKWLAERNIDYDFTAEEKIEKYNGNSFISISYTVYHLEFKTEEDMILFKMMWEN